MLSIYNLADTTVVLKPLSPQWPGPYKVTLEVKDQQGLACPDQQVLNLDVCTCEKQGVCGARGVRDKGATLGAAAIGLMLLGLLMLLRMFTQLFTFFYY